MQSTLPPARRLVVALRDLTRAGYPVWRWDFTRRDTTTRYDAADLVALLVTPLRRLGIRSEGGRFLARSGAPITAANLEALIRAVLAEVEPRDPRLLAAAHRLPCGLWEALADALDESPAEADEARPEYRDVADLDEWLAEWRGHADGLPAPCVLALPGPALLAEAEKVFGPGVGTIGRREFYNRADAVLGARRRTDGGTGPLYLAYSA